MEVYTIGFTQTTAAGFFGKLKQAGIRRLVDVRLNNVSQLAGFAKRDDLEFFLAEICGAEYVHEPRLAPTQEILDAYKKAKGELGGVRTPVPATAGRPPDRDATRLPPVRRAHRAVVQRADRRALPPAAGAGVLEQQVGRRARVHLVRCGGPP